MIHCINKPVRGGNVMIKVDMAKAYDSIDWEFLLHVMRSFGFVEGVCDIIRQCITSPCLSMMMNGTAKGFFKSGRGLRQGTGDHTFERRLRLGGPLLKKNIATMVLESPFYGQRRPMLQYGAKLLCVSDLLLLGRATIEEARSLLYWLDSEAGFGKMGICGLSMGGVHAAMVGSLHPTPVATLPFLSPHSAVVAFCEGILKHGTAWEALREDPAAHKSAMTLEEVRERMRNVLSLTDVTRFPIPKNPDAVIFVAATDDGYIPKHSVLELQKAWTGSEVRWVTGGHVSSFLLHNGEFRKAIVDGLNRLEWKESPS